MWICTLAPNVIRGLEGEKGDWQICLHIRNCAYVASVSDLDDDPGR